MGCVKSKGEPADGDNLQGGKNANQVSGTCPLTNESLGMSQRQIFSLKQSWKGVKRRLEDTGIDMFERLFRSDPNMKRFFVKFRDINSIEELRSNEGMEYHATVVMTTLDDAITHIDNYDYVHNLLTKISVSHIKFPGFTPEVFMKIREPFLEAVRVTLGDRYTDNIRSIYELAITYILQTMVDGLNDALKKSGETTVNGKPHIGSINAIGYSTA